MLNKELINERMQEIKEKGRLLDFYKMSDLFECRQTEIIQALEAYRNDDGGFGHGLEPDVRLPESSVVCTNEAAEIVAKFDETIAIKSWIKAMVHFYEKTFIKEKHMWFMAPKEIDHYPRASWWNYEGIAGFGYGNPTPQITGFLYRYRDYLETLDIDKQVNHVVDYIVNEFPNESRKHNILSCLMFYNEMPEVTQERIHEILQKAVDRELEQKDWESYCLQPYEIKLINPRFLDHHQETLEENLRYFEDKLKQGLIMPNWSWGQFDDVFETVKWEWAGHLTYSVVKAILS